MQSTLFPIEIIQEFPYPGSSADLKSCGYGSDSHTYALKTMEDNKFLPISEWVGYHFCRALGIATPDFEIVKRPDGTLAFGSRWVSPSLQIPNKPSFIDITNTFSNCKNEISEIYALDVFLSNIDRHGKNILFRQSDTKLIPLAFDFSRAWIILSLPFGIEIQKSSNTLKWWYYFKNTLHLTPSSHIFDKIERFPDNWLKLVLNNAPQEWTSEFDVSKTLEFWLNNRADRCHYAKSML